MVMQLKRIPIIEIAVEKTNISRATYYLWRKKDAEFAKLADEAISEGVAYINDLSESQLITLIKDRDIQSIRFWLSHRHPAYAAKLNINANINNFQEKLRPDQQKVVDEALKLLSLSEGDESSQGENKNETDTENN